MPFAFGPQNPQNGPTTHEDLIAALNQAVGEATNPKAKEKSKLEQWANTISWVKFWARAVLGVVLQGAAFWAVGYVLAWQNILPFVPEWWHGLAFASAWWLFQTLTPPQFIVRRP